MRLIPFAPISLQLTTALSADALPRSEIWMEGTPTGQAITGAVLETALKWHDFLLLLVTDDILHEDTLRIYLLDSQLHIVDWATIGAMYATGALSQLDLSAEDEIRFRYMGDTVWMLTLFPSKRLASSMFPAPRGVRRPWTLFRHFNLTGRPSRERSNGHLAGWKYDG